MFDPLALATSDVAVGAAYKVALELFETFRNQEPNVRRRESSFVRSFQEVPETDQATKLAADVIREIEATEEKPLSELSEMAIAKYTCVLAKVVGDRLAAEGKVDTQRGRVLLKELEKEYRSLESGAQGKRV